MNQNEAAAAIVYLLGMYPKSDQYPKNQATPHWPLERRKALTEKLLRVQASLEQLRAVVNDLAMTRRDWSPPESIILARLEALGRGEPQKQYPRWIEVWRARQNQANIQHDGRDETVCEYESWRSYYREYRKAKTDEHRRLIFSAYENDARRMFERRLERINKNPDDEEDE